MKLWFLFALVGANLYRAFGEENGKGRWSLSAQKDEKVLLWKELSMKRRKTLAIAGWNERAWNERDPSLMNFYNEAEYEWGQLSKKRRAYWRDQGFNRKKWESQVQEQHDSLEPLGTQKVVPQVVKLSLTEMNKFNISYFENPDFAEFEVDAGYGQTTLDDEQEDGREDENGMPLKDFLAKFHAGHVDRYWKVEDDDPDLGMFSHIGEVYLKEVQKGLAKSKLGGRYGAYKPEWQTMDPGQASWSLWVGAKGTMTPVHFDTDLFNFLYVVEGKKRVVIIPNDERTLGMYPVKSFYSGSAWAGIDVLSDTSNLPEGSKVLDVGPGEGVLIPERWWHAVVNLEDTVSYGYRVVGAS